MCLEPWPFNICQLSFVVPGPEARTREDPRPGRPRPPAAPPARAQHLLSPAERTEEETGKARARTGQDRAGRQTMKSSLPPLLSLTLVAIQQSVVTSFTTPRSRRWTKSTASTSPLFRAAPADADVTAPVESVGADESNEQFGAWMPLGSASCLTGLSPVQVRVCGLDIAVWHAPLTDKRQRVATSFSAFVDACPHRLAPLSQGRVDDATGCIECPYHGWQFDGSGNLTALPQLDPGKSLESVKAGREATALPVHKAGDLLFVFLPTEVTGESWPISRLPEHHYPYLQENIDNNANWFVRELPYSFDFLLENFLDPGASNDF